VEIVRNADGSLVVPVAPQRHGAASESGDAAARGPDADAAASAPTTRVLHPGEGGYDEALAEWDLQQNPDREPLVSTATGREEALALVHAVATSPDQGVAQVLDGLDDPEACGEALRFVLIGGVHAVEDFATEVAAQKGGDPIPAHQMTKIIGEVLAKLDQ